MVDDLLGGLKENVKKSRNPFFGTFIVTWSVRHWDLYYSIFTFDPGTKLSERKEYINNYFDYHHFYKELICCAFLALAILIISYLFMAFTRFIKKIYHQNVIPWVNTRFRTKEIKTIGEYNILMIKYDDELKKYELLKQKNASLNVSYRSEMEAHQKLLNGFDGAKSKKEYIENIINRGNIKSLLQFINKIGPTSRFSHLNQTLETHQYEIGFLLFSGLIEEYQMDTENTMIRVTDFGREFLIDI